MINYLNNIINIKYDENNNLVTISCETDNPMNSYYIVRNTFILLEEIIIKTNIKHFENILSKNIENYNIKKANSRLFKMI